MLPGILTGLLLIDLASTFNVPLGIMSQIRSIRSSVTLIAAVCMGGLSIRFQHKSLLLVGLTFFIISAFGSGLAPDYLTLLLLYSLGGLGMAMVNPMINTIVGEQYSVQQRSSIVGWLVAAASFSYVVGAPIINAINDYGGWRVVFLGYVLGVPLLALILVFKTVPSLKRSVQHNTQFLEGFHQVLSHRSALASLVAIVCSSVAWQAFVTFHASFIRDRFGISPSFIAIMVSATALSFTGGSLLSGRFANSFGRKRVTSVTALIVGILAIGYLNMFSFWISQFMVILGCFLSGIRYAASNSLALEQLSSFRGTMMSLNSVAINLGATIGTAIGGAILLVYSWELVGLVLGVFSLCAASIFVFFVSDPVANIN